MTGIWVRTSLLILWVIVAHSTLLPEGYSRDRRPNLFSDKADVCSFDIGIYKIGKISETSMTMNTDLFFRVSWEDKRLNLSTLVENKQVNRGFVSLAGSEAASLWKPNIYFKDALDESTPNEVSRSQFTRVYVNGTVMQSRRVLLDTRCPLDLSFFPLDSQQCSICFSSYEYDDSEQHIQWKNNDIQILDSEDTATFVIHPIATRTTTVRYWSNIQANYTTLCFKVAMRRKMMMYLITMYLPSMALVVLSWISFWIEKSAVPARAGLTITTVLAQITLITGTANKFPSIADLKLGDIYMIVNFFFVFGALIEFAMVNADSSAKKLKKEKKQQAVLEKRTTVQYNFVHPSEPATPSDNVNNSPESGPTEEKVAKKPAQWKDFDGISKKVFPSLFLIWNIFYFGIGFGLSSIHN
ncbi:glycine receptor subunit alpha-2-like isoform X2 [Convolutriloba macropyga]|uniref:glycine receptor subunit alpha-2-like isoform X2 n=1 Tax=Convolutriloba macropyga TaxID=536237 RepID=UPI003F51F202